MGAVPKVLAGIALGAPAGAAPVHPELLIIAGYIGAGVAAIIVVGKLVQLITRAVGTVTAITARLDSHDSRLGVLETSELARKVAEGKAKDVQIAKLQRRFF